MYLCIMYRCYRMCHHMGYNSLMHLHVVCVIASGNMLLVLKTSMAACIIFIPRPIFDIILQCVNYTQ